MMNAPVWLTAGYVALAVLLLIVLVRASVPRWGKLTLTLLLTGFYFVNFEAVQGLFGWPASESLPARFVLLATVIDEPSQASGSKGAIYVWINALEANKPAAKPRAYQLPYGKDVHAMLTEAMKKNRNGISQMGRADAPPSAAGLAWLRAAGADAQKIIVQDMPAAALPEK
jgi:hypothetical protein